MKCFQWRYYTGITCWKVKLCECLALYLCRSNATLLLYCVTRSAKKEAKQKESKMCWGNRLAFIVTKLWRPSTPDEFIRKLAEACVLLIIPYHSPAIFPELLKLSPWVMYVVWVSAISHNSSLKVTLKHPLTLRRRLMETISTSCMRTYQGQGHKPRPWAVSSCHQNSVWHFHETRNRVFRTGVVLMFILFSLS